jgi:uncharacterized protein (TIGR02757 family)
LDRDNLRSVLEHLYRTYDFGSRISSDPIKYPRRYKQARDIEVVGFVSSCLAYGRVNQFMSVIEELLSLMRESPYEFILDFQPQRQWQRFAHIQYRFQTNEDIMALLAVLSEVLKRYHSIENAFKAFYKKDDIKGAIEGFFQHIIALNSVLADRGIVSPNSKGFLQLFPLPSKGSPCKRMNLFLRWMVRDRDIDFGIWKGISKSRLIIPLDTHIARISRCLELTKRTTQDWKMAEEITDSLREIDPEDPLKYDFALCHQGIKGICSKECSPETTCSLFFHILKG